MRSNTDRTQIGHLYLLVAIFMATAAPFSALNELVPLTVFAIGLLHYLMDVAPTAADLRWFVQRVRA